MKLLFSLKNICFYFARARLLFYLLPLFMLLLVVGTVAQRYIGLYEAEKLFFNSFIYWWGGLIPLPSNYTLLGLISLSLIAKLLLKSPWNTRHSGIIITHFGVILLLVGGLFSAFSSEEGFVSLMDSKEKNAKESRSNIVSDYHQRELVLTKNGTDWGYIDFYDIATGSKLTTDNFTQYQPENIASPLPFNIQITKLCHNCKIENITESSEDNKIRQGTVQNFTISEDKLSKQNEENIAGIEFELNVLLESQILRTYIALESLRDNKVASLDFGEDNYKLIIRKKQRPLPFTIILRNFEKQHYGGTEMAKSYISDVTIIDGEIEWEKTIEMNKPLRYKGYTLYQSSYLEDINGNQYSILAVVKNSGRVFPYVSSIVICIGLLIHLFVRRIQQPDPNTAAKKAPQVKLSLVLLLSFFLLNTSNANASTQENTEPTTIIENIDLSAFGQLPLQHEGRIKPLASFAKLMLKLAGEGREVSSYDASKWLAEALFRPDAAIHRRIFHINNKIALSQLGLQNVDDRKKKKFSSAELLEAFSEHKHKIMTLVAKSNGDLKTGLSEDEIYFVNLYLNLNQIMQIYRSLIVLLPNIHNLHTDYKEIIGIKDNGYSYFDLLQIRDKVFVDALAISAKMKQNISDASGSSDNIIADKFMQSSAEDKSIIATSFYMSKLQQELEGNPNNLLRIIPAEIDFKVAKSKDTKNSNEWLSPWQAISTGQAGHDSVKIFDLWRNLAVAYYKNDATTWQNNILAINQISASYRTESNLQLELEYYYNLLDLPLIITALYFAYFVILLMIFATKKSLSDNYGVRLFTNLIFSSAIFIHVAVLVARTIILSRPPVSTLYESVLFVSAIIAIFAIFVDAYKSSKKHENSSTTRKKKSLGSNKEAKIFGSLTAGLLMIISGIFAKDADSMVVLVAVLNTNFWLATHVLTITIGYGASLLVGVMAHVALYNLRKHGSMLVASRLQFIALVALLFTAVGTILGGVWADQSWGRFWGWDPKENGALLLATWLTWVLHGKISKHFDEKLYTIMLAITNIIVAISWFGVNLLNIGLHSYGFTDKMLYGLVGFCITEFIIIALLAQPNKKQNRQNNITAKKI